MTFHGFTNEFFSSFDISLDVSLVVVFVVFGSGLAMARAADLLY